MHYFLDMTVKEIADAQGTGFTTIDYRIKAGVRKLRSKMSQ